MAYKGHGYWWEIIRRVWHTKVRVIGGHGIQGTWLLVFSVTFSNFSAKLWLLDFFRRKNLISKMNWLGRCLETLTLEVGIWEWRLEANGQRPYPLCHLNPKKIQIQYVLQPLQIHLVCMLQLPCPVVLLFRYIVKLRFWKKMRPQLLYNYKL